MYLKIGYVDKRCLVLLYVSLLEFDHISSYLITCNSRSNRHVDKEVERKAWSDVCRRCKTSNIVERLEKRKEVV